ncbi:MAG: helix-turn-helix transcriptional regulator [Chloroflexi bacterium]|nr:helix-turn-helix transcriptional regulator [Chloroflexota bacterium]
MWNRVESDRRRPRVKHAERMMPHAAVTREGIELTFADGCKGVIPFSRIRDVGNPQDVAGIELPNPYQVSIRGLKGEVVELTWDFVRHYCDSAYRPRVEAVAAAGEQPLGNRVRAIPEAAEMTQSELATVAGIGRVTEVRIENGEQSPRYETLVAIARGLKRPVADLLEGEPVD